MSEQSATLSDDETEYRTIQIGLQDVDLPIEWDVRTVEKLFEIRKEGFDPDSVDEQTKVQLYSMPAYDDNGEPVTTSAGEVGSKKYTVPEDTILFPKLNIFLKRFWRVRHKHNIPAICSTEYWPLVPKEKISLDYYYYYFNSRQFMSNPKVSLASGTDSHRRVQQGSFERATLPVPPINEQERIAEILSTVDEKIQLTKEIVEKARELKRGLMQDLLIKGINNDEFKSCEVGPETFEIPDDWGVVTVSDVALRFISGGTPDTETDDYWGGDIPWTTCAVVEGPFFEGQKDYITQSGLESSSASIVPSGGLLFGTRVNVANVGKTQKDIAVSQDLTGIVVDENKMDSDFLTWYLLFNQEKIRERYSQGSTIQGMIMSDLKSLPVLSPPLPEQRKIANILSDVERKIQEAEGIINETEEFKRGLMQDLLTGKVRVNPDTDYVK